MAANPVFKVVSQGEAVPSMEGTALSVLNLPVRLHFGRILSDEELLVFCRANQGFDIESDADGSITVMSPAGSSTSRMNQLINAQLVLWAHRNGGAVFGPDLGVRFPDRTLRGPDCAWLSEGKWTEMSHAERENFLPLCPEFVVELRSRTDRAPRLQAKMEFWMNRGAVLGWLIDPARRLAMIYRPGREPETLPAPAWLEGEGPIAGFRLDMAEFWKQD